MPANVHIILPVESNYRFLCPSTCSIAFECRPLFLRYFSFAESLRYGRTVDNNSWGSGFAHILFGHDDFWSRSSPVVCGVTNARPSKDIEYTLTLSPCHSLFRTSWHPVTRRCPSSSMRCKGEIVARLRFRPCSVVFHPRNRLL